MEPTWEPVEYIQGTKALDDFEREYGNIDSNNGRDSSEAGGYAGQPEEKIKELRRNRKKRK